MSLLDSIRANRLATAAEQSPEEKWKHFLLLGTIVSKVSEGYAILSAIMAHPALFEAGGRQPDRNASRAFNDPAAMFSLASSQSYTKDHIQSDAKATTMFVRLPDRTITVMGLLAQATPEQAKAHEVGRTLIRSLFPELDLDKIRITDGVAKLPPEMARELPIEALASLKVPEVGSLDISSWGPEYRGLVRFRLTPYTVTLMNGDVADRITDHSDFRIEVDVQVTIALPMEYCLWATNSTPQDYVPMAMWQLFRRKWRFSAGQENEKQPPARVPNPDHLARVSTQMRDRYGIAPRVKTNAEGICSVPAGKLYWVPAESGMSYPALLNSCVQPDGSIDTGPLASRHVATDWTVDKLTLTDAQGNPHIVDLTGARPPTPAALAHVARAPIDTDLWSGIIRLANRVGVSLSTRHYANAVEAAGKAPITWENLINVPFSVEPVHSQLVDNLFSLGKQIGEAYDKLVASDVPVWEQYEIRPYMALFGAYASRMGDFQKALGEQVAHNRMAVPKELGTLHDMPGVEGVMPHQVRIGATLSTNPKGAEIGVRAGGGKCLVGETNVYTSQGMQTLQELWDAADPVAGDTRPLTGVSVHTDSGVRPATAVYRSKGPIVEVVLSNGTRIRGLAEHRMQAWTRRGLDFVRLDNLAGASLPCYYPNLWSREPAVLSRVELDSRNNTFHQPRLMTPRIAALMGWLVSEGTNNSDDVVLIAQHDTTVLKAIRADLIEVFRLDPTTVRIGKQGKAVYVYNAGLKRWFENNGVVRGRSNLQEIPWSVRTSPASCVSAFLRTLFQGDGSISVDATGKGSRYRIGYSSASDTLITQVKDALENLGVRCLRYTSRTQRENAWGDVNDRHRLEIDPRSIVKFHDEVGFECGSKRSLLEAAVAHARSEKKQDTNRETQGVHNRMPCGPELRMLASRMENAFIGTRSGTNTMGWNTLRRASGVSMPRGWRDAENPTRYTLRRLLDLINAGPTEWLTRLRRDRIAARILSRIHECLKHDWVQVTSVEHTGIVRDVFDLVVPGPHNYAFSGVLGHNTWSIIHDITDLFSKGLISRPGVVMPRNLLPQFAKEVIRFTKGHLRPFLINSTVWRGFQRRVGSNPNGIRELIARQPRNTVLLLDYGWLAMHAQTIEMGDESAVFYPHAAMVAMLGLDYVTFDESQRAKKLSTGRTMAASMLAASTALVKQTEGGGYIRISSGTILHNTARDVIGQMALIEPMALGAVGQEIRDNDRVSMESLPALRNAMGAFARKIFVPRKEWAHLLPPMVERVHPCELTHEQKKFYDGVMKNVLDSIRNDPKVRRLMKQDSDQAEARLESLLRRYFAKVEIWLNAPDADDPNAYGNVFTKLENLSAVDMVSPKVRTMDELIDQHLNGGTIDLGNETVSVGPSTNKILILGYNKATSKHVMKHSRHAARLLHYTAGDDATLEKFKADDGYIGLVADETSIAEGHNLQMCDRIIRFQSMWTPGAQEQAHARVWRPDVPDKDGRMRYHRDRILLDWIIVAPSIEVAKMARLIGKQIDNLLIEEMDSSPTLRRLVDANHVVFSKIKPIRMNLDYLEKYQTVESLSNQFQGYALVKQWERGEFAEARKRLRAEISERIGRPVKDSELAAMSMIRVDSVNDPATDPGDALQGIGYVPWADGFTGYNPTGLHLEPLSMPEDGDEEAEGDDVDGDVEENIHVEAGDPVLTEFGIGYITMARANTRFVNVMVPGFSDEPVKLWRYTVLAATNPIDKRALAGLLRSVGEQGRPTLTVDRKSGTLTPRVAAIPADTIRTHVQAARKADAAGQPPPTSELVRRAARNLQEAAPRAPSREGVRPEPIKGSDEHHEILRVGSGHYTVTRGKDVVHVVGKPYAWKLKTEWNDKVHPGILDSKAKAFRHAKALLAAKLGAPGSAVPAGPKGVSRAPGIPARDPMTRPSGKAPVGKAPKAAAPINILKVDPNAGWDTRDAHAVLFNGLVCLMTDDGGDRDELLLRNGFDRIGKSVVIRVKNPKAYRALVDLLAQKFTIPRANKRALDQFGDIYAAQRANVAYLKPKELVFHSFWVRDQRKKAVDKMEVRPWPVVEDGLVYLYINVETCPAGMRLKNMSMPTGVARPILVKPALIAMLKGSAALRQLLKTLEAKKVRLGDADTILEEIRHIRG